MTTIAYKDGVIAYDSRMTKTNGTLISDNYQKKIERDGVIFFFTGGTASFDKLIKAYLTGNIEFPINANAVVIDGDDIFYIGCDPDSEPQECWKEPISPQICEAWGSGSDFALTAMDMGANAFDAVKMAAKRDVYTGGDIKTYEIKTVK